MNAGIHQIARIAPGCFLGSNLMMAEGAGFGANSKVLGPGRVVLGRNLRMGPECMFVTGDHVVPGSDKSFDDSGRIISGVTIAGDVYLGARVIVLPGVAIGRGAAVGAGAVVTRDVPEHSIVGRVLARLIR